MRLTTSQPAEGFDVVCLSRERTTGKAAAGIWPYCIRRENELQIRRGGLADLCRTRGLTQGRAVPSGGNHQIVNIKSE